MTRILWSIAAAVLVSTPLLAHAQDTLTCNMRMKDVGSGDYFCPGGCAGPVWGEGPYTDDSAICTAARHAGVIDGDGGMVRVNSLPGLDSFPASTANGVSTTEWGQWPKAFEVLPSTAVRSKGKDAGQPGVLEASCGTSLNAISDAAEGTILVSCPSKCEGSVWGSSIYTSDSSICTAAVHAGLGEGAVVRVIILPGQEQYVGTDNHGVSSSSWGDFERSFSLTPK